MHGLCFPGTQKACLRPAINVEAIPVFIKQASDSFRHVGHFAAAESLTAPLDCAPYARNTSFTSGQVSHVIKLKRC
jgi:hypothetical protein